MNRELISVVIVNWNGKQWLKKCLDSLQKQSYKNIEVVFVDNGSTDGSVEFVTKNYKKIKVLSSKINLGFSGGNNLGIQAAKGKYIALLNSDTWIENNFFDTAIKNMNENNADVYGSAEFDYKGKDIHGRYTPTVDFLGHTVIFNSIRPGKLFYFSGAFMLFRKSLYTETGGLDNDFFMYCEEVDWFWRLHLYGKTIYKDDKNHFNHYGAGSQTGILSESRFRWRNQNALQILLKNYSSISLIFFLPIYVLQNIIEMLAFLLVLKPKISLTYIEGWLFNIKIIKKTLKKRRLIQKNRIVSDSAIIGKMYFGLGKIKHIINYFSKK
jgi:GT2 family glycosyltransferase